MKPLLSLLVLLLLASCLGKEIKSNAPTKISVQYPQLINDKLANFPIKELPLLIDSAFFAADTIEQDYQGNLDIEMVKLLSSRLASDDASDRERYYLNDFFQIAQAKNEGTYDTLLAHLDIGMTENASCNAIGRIEFGDTMGMIIWEINYKSYDACPYYNGHHVLGTLIKNGNVVSCIQLAAREYGADAPMSFEAYQLASIAKNGVITTRNYSQTNEEDLKVESASAFFKYQITSKGYKALK